MQNTYIFWPILVVLLIPIFVLFLNAKRKANDRAAGISRPEAAIDNTAWSLPVVLTSNALANQFQLPVVFYVLAFINFNLDTVNMALLVLCWVFAFTRWVHAIIHVTSNKISLRVSFFGIGAISLLILFGMTIRNLIHAG